MVSTNPIEGTPYSCESDKNLLFLKKSELDGFKKNNSTNSSKLQLLELDYSTSKKKYDESPCGKDPETNKCIELQADITRNQSLILYSRSIRDDKSAKIQTKQLEDKVKEFSDTKCGEKIGSFRAGVVSNISEGFQTLDKLRIEEESKYQAKQKIFFGGIVFLGAVLIITIFGKKK